MKNKNFNKLITKVIVSIILLLYIFFLYMDFYNVKFFIASAYIKYLCILLCFLLSILSTKKPLIGTEIVNHRDIVLLRLGMFITVIADLCLVIFNFYILGVVFFSLVQITYCVRYTTKRLNVILTNFFIVFIGIAFLYWIASLFVEEINMLLPISLFYFICLLTSVSKAIKSSKNNLYTSPTKYMIILGMILFLLCDICVGLSNITVNAPLSGYFMIRFREIICFLIWFFYIPSQLLLALSGNGKIIKVDFK
jgi:hypothetical protein